MAESIERIFGPQNVPSGTSTVFTAGALKRYAIKTISIVNGTAGPITIRLGINGVADADLILPDLTLQAGEWANYDGMHQIEAGDTIDADADDTGLAIEATALEQDV